MFCDMQLLMTSVSVYLSRFLLIFLCLLLSILATIGTMRELCNQLVYAMELLLLAILGIECVLRVWSAGCRSRFQGTYGRIRFIRQPLCILDIVVVTSTFLIFIVGSNGWEFRADALRGLRFLQFLRLVRLDRRGNTWKLLGSVVWAHRQELLTTWYISFLALIAISFSVYALEHKDNPEDFENLPDSLYYGLITLTTIGYGDKTPTNWSGKLVCTLFAILGASFFALPAGILGSGFALQVQQQQRQKHFARRRHPAAQLIQCLWRCYAADPNSISAATWKLHLRPVSSPTTGSFRTNTLISRLSIKRNHGNNSPMPHRGERGSKKFPCSHDTDDANGNEKKYMGNGSHLGHCTDSVRSKVGDDHDETEKITKLEEKHKNAIRAIRKIKYFVARRKFKEALRPYDVKDVIEQYSAGHTDMLARIKSLQANLDQTLGKPVQERRKGRLGSIDVFDPSMSLNTRVTRVERKMNLVDRKLDMLIELYRDDNQRHGRRSDSSVEGAICEMSEEGAGSIGGGNGGGGNKSGDGGETVKDLIDIGSSPKGFKRRWRGAYNKPSTLEIQDEPSSTSSVVTPVESITATELLQQLSTSQPLLSPPLPPTPPYMFSSVFSPTLEVTASGTKDEPTEESPLIDVPLVSVAPSKETDMRQTKSVDINALSEDRETRI
ncbi:potassium voltage-gated channel subfamily KQT member 4-like isoform X2 [Anneissia japonica]|uniref:potassium voltage-gated channel subfamily KQT member 4-like isoform X2 n=1 Tax=Anneissia japonica TaxID=1529436 RepID=UPI00142594D1|nr:potassium voltage-gated channel subfamily KQT member 4-like isoform X2 [Anneissia japonica]